MALQAYEITLAGVEEFQHGERAVLWLAPEPREALDALQLALWRALPECDALRRRPGGFTPHLTIGQAGTRAARDMLLAELRAYWRPVSFMAQCVSLIARGAPPDDLFAVERELPLSPRSAAACAVARAAPR
jgi:2'-5' RNA ligase